MGNQRSPPMHDEGLADWLAERDWTPADFEYAVLWLSLRMAEFSDDGFAAPNAMLKRVKDFIDADCDRSRSIDRASKDA